MGLEEGTIICTAKSLSEYSHCESGAIHFTEYGFPNFSYVPVGDLGIWINRASGLHKETKTENLAYNFLLFIMVYFPNIVDMTLKAFLPSYAAMHLLWYGILSFCHSSRGFVDGDGGTSPPPFRRRQHHGRVILKLGFGVLFLMVATVTGLSVEVKQDYPAPDVSDHGHHEWHLCGSETRDPGT